jgi:hypothetical protein
MVCLIASDNEQLHVEGRVRTFLVYPILSTDFDNNNVQYLGRSVKRFHCEDLSR